MAREKYLPDESALTERLWRLMQDERGTSAGIALWLKQQAGLTQREIVALTWDDVDLERGAVRTKRGEILLIREVADVLREEHARRAPDDDPHITLTPRSRRPMNECELSRAMHAALRRGGIDERDALRGTRRQRERIMRHVRATGRVTRREVEAMLGISQQSANRRLQELMAEGKLTRYGKFYVSN